MALCCAFPVASADPAPAPPPPPTGGIVSLIEAPGFGGSSIYRSTSFVEMIDLELADKYKKNRSTCNDPKARAKNLGDCPTFEFSVPYLFDPTEPTKSGVEVSEEIAGDLQYEWQRFQERSWWHIQVGTNNAIDQFAFPPYEAYRAICSLVNVDGVAAKNVAQAITGKADLARKPAPFRLSIPPGSTNKDFKKPDGINYDEPSDGIDLDAALHPRLGDKEYCDGVDLDFVPDNPYPVGVFTPSVLPCVYNVCGVAVGPYPNPSLPWGHIDWPKVNARQKRMCDYVVSKYYKEYTENVMKIIAKKMPLAIQWDGLLNWDFKNDLRSGVVSQPVASYKTNAKDIIDLSNKVKDPFIAPYLKSYGKHKNGGFLYPSAQFLQTMPGVGQLEEIKRWLPVGNIMEQSRDGYITHFQVYGSVDTVFDWRPTKYWFYSVRCNSWFGGGECHPEPRFNLMSDLVITPAGCQQLRPEGGAGTITYEMPRYHFRWINTPEGYTVPGLKNHPVLRLE